MTSSTERLPLTATYRLQMNAGFTLAQARERVEYFAKLGVSHLYLSPILAARPGSMHGYDVVDPTRVNPELGTEDDLRALSSDLHARGMGIILDIVPNHMGVGPDNRYWDDVLTHGERSRYARWFDIDWTEHKVILPILGDELDRILDRGELSVKLVEGETPRIEYFSNSFPVDPSTLPPELQLAQVDPLEAGAIAKAYSNPAARDRLRALLDAQHYRLVFWREGSTEINYRRFFDVNDLAALRAEDPEVFAQTHDYVLRLVHEGVIDGLRIDHIDGLRQPVEYLTRLRNAVGPGTPIFVEKILSPGEQLPLDWPVQGTTGYEFLTDLDDALIDPGGFAEIERCYRRMRHLEESFHDIARAGKQQILGGALQADVDRLVALLEPLAKAGGHRWPASVVTQSIVQLLVALPVYRTYAAPGQRLSDADRKVVDTASAEAIARGAQADIIGFVASLVKDDVPAIDPAARMNFVQRLQQLSGPATAKGIEDTALYAYIPLVSRNEVGGSPERPLDNPVERLHEANALRAAHWPLTLLATNTHDTKRSADVRARITALSEMPQEWERSVKRWRKLNDKHRRTVNGRMAPDTNGEYLVYQTLVALWPSPRSGRRIDDVPDRTWREATRDRLTQYMMKAAREAKNRTSWVDPDPAYEDALKNFISQILQANDDAPFLTDVARLVSRIAMPGVYNALSRVAIHLTAPGTPDIYQGDEFWNYTLVDPDNRKQVDYAARASALAELPAHEQRAELELGDNKFKLFLTNRLLAARRAHAELFTHGDYQPLTVRGKQAEHVVAFARNYNGKSAVTIASRLMCGSLESTDAAWWGDTAVDLPHDSRGRAWQSQVGPAEARENNDVLEVARVLAKLPVAVLVG